jgi:divalent metal cation (Fe/Co/Zn/Cd) transporter
MMSATLPLDRRALVRRSRWLNIATIGYNSLEGIVAIGAGVLSGSIALVGFGLDSAIELGAGATALWRLGADADLVRRERVERRALRLVGVSFLALAVYVSVEAVGALTRHALPERSWFGVAIAVASLIVMPALAKAKRGVALQLRSGALAAEARQTQICVYLSAILLGGLLLNAMVGWWWADPVAALAMVPLITWEGLEGIRGRSACADGC